MADITKLQIGNDELDITKKQDKMAILSYGHSTWSDFINVYQKNAVVYCRASSNSNPATGSQTRMAFMAYVNNAENPTEVEFQYVRSVSSKTASQPVDQVFVYKLANTSGGTWTVQTRNMGPKLAAGTGASVTYSNGTYTVNATEVPVPTKTSDLTNDGSDGTSTYVEADDLATVATSGSYSDLSNTPNLATVATSGSYNDLSNKPTIPTVNNATLTIQKNGTNVETFTANSSTNKTANITVPVKTSDITNDGSDGTDTYVESGDLATVATTGSYNDLSNKPTIPTVGTGVLTIQKNSSNIDTFSANATSNKTINITVPTTAADVSALPSSTKYGASISVSVDSTDYKITTTLKDQDGNTLGTAQVIDLPLESVVVSGSFDSTNKKIILTLENGNTVDIPVGDLVAGLQTEITSTNKLDSDLVDDTGQTNRFMTSAEKTKLSGIAAGAEVNVQSDWNQTTTTADDYIKNKPELATVATSGSYNDLSNKPTIPTVNNATLTIQKNGTTVKTFTANASSNVTANIVVPTKTSDLTNDGSDNTSTYVESDELATVATSGSYNDLSNKPTIPAAQVNSDWNSTSGVSQILNKPTLATVATSGSYNDLSNKPTIPTVNNATLTIQKNGTNVQTFTANQSTNATANITVPTKTSDLTNDSDFVEANSLSTVATSGNYNDLSNKPTIPTVNNATLTIQKNGTTINTFTANASSNVTANIQVPTTTSDLTNNSGFISSITKITNEEIDAIVGIS